jgi:uncharacterized protein (TIGR03437 family)
MFDLSLSRGRLASAAAFLCALPIFAQVTPSSIITKFPISNWTFPANGAAATDAPIFSITSLTTDTNGNIVFADPGNHVVLRINSDGTVTVLAGNGLEGFSGDGGPAVAASLDRPSDAAVDSLGNLYIYDEYNERIRLVTPDGTINTIAGTGRNVESGNGGPAQSASIGRGDRIALDSANNLYVVAPCQIRRITTDGIISVFAGNGNCAHSGDGLSALKAAIIPNGGGITFDSKGNLYFAELGNGYIRKISAVDGTISTVVGNGKAGFSSATAPGLQIALYQPQSLAADSAGNVYFSEIGNDVVRKLAPDGTVSVIAGLSPLLFFPKGLAFDGQGNLNVSDTGNFQIRRIGAPGSLTSLVTVAGNGQFRTVPDGTAASQAFLYGPGHIVFDQSGNLLISQVSFHKIAQILASDGSMQIIAGTGVAGYGGPVNRPLIAEPRQITTDGQGNIYFVDTAVPVLYKITTDGKLNRIAGQYATFGNTGDGGPALSATFNYPWGVAVDPSGVVFVSDRDSSAVRRIATDGTISTYAGTGTPGFSGDNGQANTAQLSLPYALALDGNSNLLICDAGNNRVRQVAPDGTITTLAGTGVAATSGDGGPATQAAVNGPLAIALDNEGGYYLLTSGGARLRHVDANGNISTIAGNGTTQLNQGDGGPAGQALIEGDGLAVDAFGNVFISSFNSDSVRVILNFEPSIFLTNKSFSAFPDSSVSLTGVVSGGAMTAPQAFSVAGDFTGIVFNLTADQPWVVLANTQGTTPATMTFVVDPTSLAPGNYTGNISLTRVGGAGSFAVVHVSVNVIKSKPPALSLQPLAISLSAALNETTSQSQTIQVLNTGSGDLKYQLFADGAGAGALRAPTALQQGVVSAGTPVNIPITADSFGYKAGTYAATLSVQSSTTNESRSVPVSINITALTQRMSLTQRGLTFIGVQGGGVTPPQNFSVVNAGGGSFNWTAKATVMGGVPSWLSITPQAGTSTAGSPAPSVTVTANPKALPGPGVYYGLVRVSSSGASNSPQEVEVVLNYLGAGSAPGAVVSRSGLIFVSPAGASSPSSQNISITNLNGSSLGVTPSASTYEGIPWLTVVSNKPGQIIQPGGSLTLGIAAKVDNLLPGVHVGTVLLQFPPPFRNIELAIRLIVTSNGNSGSSNIRSADGCAATTLVPVLSSLVDNFQVPAAWPVSLEATVFDDCGVPLTSGLVTVSFSNGDAPMSLTPLDSGLWEGTWFGGNSRAELELTLDASAVPLHGSQTYHGLLQPNDQVPSITHGGAMSAGAAQTAAGAGSVVSIAGTSFAAASATGKLPLNIDLAGNEVVLAGINLPLIYSSANLINVVVPYDMQPGQYNVLVTRGSQYSNPEPLVVGPAQPGIFRITTATDLGPAQSVWSLLGAGKSIDMASVAPNLSVTTGDTVSIYCTGLGAVSPALDPSQPAPSPGPKVQNPVTITLGGVAVPVTSAALVPGYAGIYVVQATIPSGITPAAAVPLVVSTQGLSSGPVNIAVH